MRIKSQRHAPNPASISSRDVAYRIDGGHVHPVDRAGSPYPLAGRRDGYRQPEQQRHFGHLAGANGHRTDQRAAPEFQRHDRRHRLRRELLDDCHRRAARSPGGAGATLVTSSTSTGYGGIDQTQAYSSITANYAMKYVDCGGAGNTGVPTTYDVRWNVMTVDANYTRLVTASARPLMQTPSAGFNVRGAR